MGCQQDGRLLQASVKKREHALSQRFVEAFEGLVQDQKVRLHCHGAGNRDPLLHPARELLRIQCGRFGDLQLFKPLQRVLPRRLGFSRDREHVVEGISPGEQARLLKHGRRTLKITGHRAAVRQLQAERAAQQRRLPAARGPHQGQMLSGAEGEAAALQDRFLPEGKRHIPQFKHGFRLLSGALRAQGAAARARSAG